MNHEERMRRADAYPDLLSRAHGVPVERLRAMIQLLGDGEITPTAKRMLTKLCDEYQGKSDIPPAPSCMEHFDDMAVCLRLGRTHVVAKQSSGVSE